MCIFEVFYNALKIDGQIIDRGLIGVLRERRIVFTVGMAGEMGIRDGELRFQLRCPIIGAVVGRDVMDGVVVLDMVTVKGVDQQGC